MLKKIFLAFVPCCVSILSFAQLLKDIQTPKIVPPSPDAAALGKYGQIPVDKSTGIPNISIPLYEVKTPRFALPISLSYHASGIKVEERASWVGAGWSLNAGGAITRAIVGFPDDGGYGILSPNNSNINKSADIQWPDSYLFVSDVLTRKRDAEPDNFFYNFNNHSGAFVFGEDKEPVLIPYEPVKIKFNHPAKTFEVTDEQGNKYFFETKENVASDIANEMSGVSTWYITTMISADLSDTIKFEYTTDINYLYEFAHNFSQNIGIHYDEATMELVDANLLQNVVKTNSLRNFYPVRISRILFNGGKVEFVPKAGRLDEGNVSLDSVVVYNKNVAGNQYNRIKSFKLVTDYFYSTLPVPANWTVSEASKHRLKLVGLEEHTQELTTVKTHQFEYNTGMLPSVLSFAQDKWGYFNGKNLNETLLESQRIVYWSGANPIVGLIGGNEGADRSLSETDMKAGVLEKIIYPTKGYTRFSYECNKQEGQETVPYTLESSAVGYYQETVVKNYTPVGNVFQSSGAVIFNVKFRRLSDVPFTLPETPYVQVKRASDGAIIYSAAAAQNNEIDQWIALPLQANVQYQLVAVAKGGAMGSSYLPTAYIATAYEVPSGSNLIKAGGLRISSIKNYSSDGTIANTETYKYGANESGGGESYAFFTTYRYNHIYSILAKYYPPPTQSNPNPSPELYFRTRPIETYSNNSVYPLATLNGSPVAYPEVTVYQGETAQNSGKSVYSYDIYKDSLLIINRGNLMVKPIPVTWKNGGPIHEAHYRNDGNNQYSIVESIHNTYQNVGRKGGTGMIVDYITEPMGYSFSDPILQPSGWVTSTVCNTPILMKRWIETDFQWLDYPIKTGSRLLKESSKYASGVTTTTTYTYDNLDHVQPTVVTTTNSKGEVFKKQLKYPADYPSVEPYATMVNRNIVSPVVEQSVFKDASTTPLQATKTNYNFWNGVAWSAAATNIIAPQTTEAKAPGQTAYEPRLRYESYDDRGNLITVSKEGDVKHSYIWGYNKTYPIAEVVNANSNEIYFSDFEQNGWEVAMPWIQRSYDNTKAHTGRYSLRIDNNSSGEVVLHSDTWLSVSLSQPTKFKYSGWVYSTGPSAEIYLFMKTATEQNYFTYVQSVLTNETNKWVYLEGEYTVPANITQLNIRLDNNSAGTVWFDDIRLHPSASQMTTYTYDPLIGMTSQTDLNNKSIYYDYDGFGRLSFVRDKDNNVLKRYCYNYAGQVEECGIFTAPIWQATGQSRCAACSLNPGYTSNGVEREETDANPNSPTYHQTRWVNIGHGANCGLASWEIISKACEVGSNGNTGNEVTTLEDKNPCSPTFGTTQQIVTSNPGACPQCNTSNCPGPGNKCISGFCVPGTPTCTATVKINKNTWQSTFVYCFPDGSQSGSWTVNSSTAGSVTTCH